MRRGHAYSAAKRRAAKAILRLLASHYPGIDDAIAMRDISTPLTQVRYTGNYDGTVLGWRPFVESGEKLEELVKQHGPGLPGLKNFYLSGVWATTGGLIRADAAGRHVVQFICRDDGVAFQAGIGDSAPLPTHLHLPVGPHPAPPFGFGAGRPAIVA